MFIKSYLIVSFFIISASGIVLCNEFNTKNIKLYEFSDKVFHSKKVNNSIDYSSPHSIFQDENRYIYKYSYLALDFKFKRFEINQLNALNDGGQIVLVSQGSFTITNNNIKLTDKNNSIVFQGLYTADSILFNIGIKYLCNKTFENREIIGMGIPSNLIEFSSWNKKYKKQKIKKNNSKQISIGYYSSESMVYMKLMEKEYEIYCNAGNNITFVISKGSWQLDCGKVILKDYDNINKFEFFIINKNTLIPNFRLPFAYEITPFYNW